MAVNFPGSSSGGGTPTSHFGSPAGTDWIVGFDDFTDNEGRTASHGQVGPFRLLYSMGGTGANSYHQNSVGDQTAFGSRVFILGSSAGGFNSVMTDLESHIFGSNTVRVGARLKYEDLPVSGGENYYHFLGVNSKGTNLEATNYAVIGINLADNATNFVVKTKGATTETVTDTGVAFASDTWYTLEIEVTPTACSAWVNGALVLDASTANLPVANTLTGASILTVSRLGSPAVVRNIYYDWAYVALKPAAARGALGTGGPWG